MEKVFPYYEAENVNKVTKSGKAFNHD